ncbi:MAG: transposase [Ferroplasma sp.]|uniref:transposase n=1 Tax=Ferroplasma sp. TaxID=2591003 RepID=UPI002815A7CA|nr:transposase [Ferroplasma sp.]WMT50595.1 MAG: transposase [Ferroplasma sp.]
MSHLWKSDGDKRTIAFGYTPDSVILKYLADMRDLTNKAIINAYSIAKSNNNELPSPITLRKSLKKYYDNNIDYAKHHINPVCRTAIAILRSYKKNNDGELKIIKAGKLAMRIDSELIKIENGKLRITVKPHEYEYIHIVDKNKKFNGYSEYKLSEVLLTDRKVCITFMAGSLNKPVINNNIIGFDLNFKSVDYTVIKSNEIVKVDTIDTSDIARAQRDYARKRKKIQKHVKNPAKRNRKLKDAKHRQKNTVTDKLQKLTTKIVNNNSEKTFVFEDLTDIKKEGKKKHRDNKDSKSNAAYNKNNKSKRFRTDINRWPYRLFQRFIDYKSNNRTLYINPEGTSSEYPVCGGKLKHPIWKISQCNNCGIAFNRDRLSSLSISVRRLYLCGTPFAVSGSASWHSMKNDYLYHPDQVVVENVQRLQERNA